MELKEVLRKRRTIRKYNKEKQITEQQLKYILSAGMAAPVSRKDYSSIKITVVQDENLLKKLSDPLKEGTNLIYNVPTLIIISTKKSEVENIECFNVACIVENMLLAATDLNLGSIYLTSFLRKIETELFESLEIDEGYEPISAVGIGYSMEEDEKEYDFENIQKRVKVFRK